MCSLIGLPATSLILTPPSDNAAWAKIPDLAPVEKPLSPNVKDFGRLSKRYVRKRASDVHSSSGSVHMLCFETSCCYAEATGF